MNRVEKIAIALAFVFVLSPYITRACSVFAGTKTVKLGIVVQRQFERNYAKIESLKKENEWMLREILKANGIVLKNKETCSLDVNTWTLHFSKNKEGLK